MENMGLFGAFALFFCLASDVALIGHGNLEVCRGHQHDFSPWLISNMEGTVDIGPQVNKARWLSWVLNS